jgi:purine-binding chemotaxis protein CheW
MHTAQAMDTDVSTVASDTQQYLTFLLADTEYGVDILRVQEIRGWDTVTPLPNTPEYARGVMNLRGAIVPIIDLRQRFGLEHLAYGETTVVVVLKVVCDHGDRIMGLVVDAVSDVYDVSGAQLKPLPDCGESLRTKCVTGLATVGKKMVVLLAVDHLLQDGALRVVDNLTHEERSAGRDNEKYDAAACVRQGVRHSS